MKADTIFYLDMYTIDLDAVAYLYDIPLYVWTCRNIVTSLSYVNASEVKVIIKSQLIDVHLHNF